jgi:hypothetical protein
MANLVQPSQLLLLGSIILSPAWLLVAILHFIFQRLSRWDIERCFVQSIRQYRPSQNTGRTPVFDFDDHAYLHVGGLFAVDISAQKRPWVLIKTR